jgi:hypothetical protein
MKIEIQNSQLEQKLEQKKDFLTLEYISILDNAIKDCILTSGDEELKKLLKNKDGEDQDIFGTSNFITNFTKNSDGEKRKFLEKLNFDLFIQVNCEKLDVPSDSCVDNEDNFYILYANIYCLRQAIVHKKKINQSPSNESSNQDRKNYNSTQKIQNLLDAIEKKSTISYYKYLFLVLPISFSFHLKNLFWAINQKSIIKENLNEIEGFIEFSKANFNTFFKGKKCSTNSSLNDNKSGFAKVKFIRNISINKSRKNLKAPNGSKMKFNFIGEKNYKDLQNLIKKINQNYPIKDTRNNDKNEINQEIFFEEIERIYELIIEINVLFRIHFTRFYNIEKQQNENVEKQINKLDCTPGDQLYKESIKIFEDMKNISCSDNNYKLFIEKLRNASEKKLTKRFDIKKKINEIIEQVNCTHEKVGAGYAFKYSHKIIKLRNNIDHSNFFGIFQTSKNKHFSLKNFQENFNNIEEFLQNFSNNSPDDSGEKPDFSSFRNQLIQALSKKDYFLIKSQYQNDIKLHRVGLDHRKIISRKKSNKQKIIGVIQKHKQDRKDEKVKKYSKKSNKQKLEFRLLKFSNYAEFKTTLIKKGLKKIELNKVKI